MKIDIILRTHDQSNVHVWADRYCQLPKRELVLGCATSLVNSANIVTDHDISFTILDDHSTDELKQGLHDIFLHSKWPYQLHELDGTGNNHSWTKQYELCRDSSADLVYPVEDDYLHCPSALKEMIDNYVYFSSKMPDRPIVIFPFDHPLDYRPPWMSPCQVVHGLYRHWRTGYTSTGTIFTRPEIFKQFWPVFEKLASKYNPAWGQTGEVVSEDNTVGVLYRTEVVRFSPVQSIALHMGSEELQDPYIDWQQWWRDYSVLLNS